jgi:hypothetical protein
VTKQLRPRAQGSMSGCIGAQGAAQDRRGAARALAQRQERKRARKWSDSPARRTFEAPLPHRELAQTFHTAGVHCKRGGTRATPAHCEAARPPVRWRGSASCPESVQTVCGLAAQSATA